VTTIAVKKEDGVVVVCSDTLMVGEWKDQGTCIKILRVTDERGDEAVIGGSGALASIYAFQDWVMGGMDPSNYPSQHFGDANFLLITRKGVYSYENYPRPIKVSLPFAIGSGSQFAMGAMLAGASAIEAVKISAKLDPYTNSKVTILELQ
jgi:ATP-dependent protease HslVU (ClpYQ) peptidase subunit